MAYLYFAVGSFYNTIWRDTLWVLGKLGGYFLVVVSFFWGIPGKVYPTLHFLLEGLNSVLDRCDASGVILHKVLFLLYLPVLLGLVREFYREHALLIMDLFLGLFIFLTIRSVYLFVVTRQLETNQAELWACFMGLMTLQALCFLSLRDVRAFADEKAARQQLFHPKEIAEAEATLLSRSFL